MREGRESSPELAGQETKRQLDVVSILVSAFLGAIIEILLEKILNKMYNSGLHGKIVHSFTKLGLFIYNPNYQGYIYNESPESHSPTLMITEHTYTATQIFGKFITNKRNWKTKTTRIPLV